MPLIDVLHQQMDAVIRQHLNHVRVFAANAVQVEDWFRGELLVVLEGLKLTPTTPNVVRYGSPLVVSVKGEDKLTDVDAEDQVEHIAIELKAWFIGSQHRKTAQSYTPIGYLDPDQMGLDVLKLMHWCGPTQKIVGRYVMGFAYPRPSQADWNNAVAQLPRKFGDPKYLGATITDLTNYAHFPPEFMIGVLDVRRAERGGQIGSL